MSNRLQPVKGATPHELVFGESYKGLLAEYGEPVHGYVKSLNKGQATWHLCLFLVKVERQDTYVLTDGVQVVLSKRIRRRDQDCPKNLPTDKKASMHFHENTRQTLEVSIIATKRRAEALPAAQTDIPREHVMLKFKDEDAEAVMAKAFEGGSDSEEALFPEPIPIPAPLGVPSEAMKRDGLEKKRQVEKKVLFVDEKTLEKVKAFPSTSLPARQPNPVTPILSWLRPPSAPSRPREACRVACGRMYYEEAQAIKCFKQESQDHFGESCK